MRGQCLLRYGIRYVCYPGDGCLIAGICVSNGAEQAGNPCMVCDTARSSSAYSAAQGKACGAGPTSCSGQDTCDAVGACVPNHFAEGASCGNGAASACDLADACDGRGTSLPRLVANSTACNDGQFCESGRRVPRWGLCPDRKSYGELARPAKKHAIDVNAPVA